MVAMLVVAGIACRPPGEELDSDDWGVDAGADSGVVDSAPESDDDTGSGGGGDNADLSVEFVDSAGNPGDDPGFETQLAASDQGGGKVHVYHYNLVWQCDAVWDSTTAAFAQDDATRIEVAYPAYDAGADPCIWNLSYDIAGVAEGTYVVSAAGTEATVSVRP